MTDGPAGFGRQELSHPAPTVDRMLDIRIAAVAFAALELVPGEPSDLSTLLSDGTTRRALIDRASAHAGDDLLAYLCAELDQGRVEAWAKRLDRLVEDGEGVPVLAGDADYPAALAQCWDQPPVLSVRGRLAADLPAVAIIGSRTADDRTVAATAEFAGAAVRGGFSVVSGLAAGVDTAAHEGALGERGHTIAVLGTGISRVFPEQNRFLATRIGEFGALLSQFAPDAPRTSTTFLRRNCVIAGLAAASVVMDGAERSGSRHEAEQAVRYGRLVLLWKPTLAGQAWAQRLVTDGAASFVEDAGQAVALASRAHLARTGRLNR